MKTNFIVCLIIIMLVLTGCSKPTPKPISEPVPSQPIGQADDLREYFPSSALIKIFTGGFENSGAIHVIDSFHDSKMQLKSISTGTGVAMIYEINPEDIRLVFAEETDEFEDSYFHREPNRNQVILKLPLEVGNTWQDDGGVYTITGVDVEIMTLPRVTYNALEVTLQREGFEAKFYYARGYGLIKTEVLGQPDIELFRVEHDMEKIKGKREVSWFVNEFLPIDMEPTVAEFPKIASFLGMQPEELLDWMDFLSEIYVYIPNFSLNEKITDEQLSQAMAHYFLEKYTGNNRVEFLSNT